MLFTVRFLRVNAWAVCVVSCSCCGSSGCGFARSLLLSRPPLLLLLPLSLSKAFLQCCASLVFEPVDFFQDLCKSFCCSVSLFSSSSSSGCVICVHECLTNRKFKGTLCNFRPKNVTTNYYLNSLLYFRCC